MKISASGSLSVAASMLLFSCHPVELIQQQPADKTSNAESRRSYIVRLSDGRIKTYITEVGVEHPRSIYEPGTRDALYLESIYGPLEVDVPKPFGQYTGTITMNPDRSLSISRGPVSSEAGIIETRVEKVLPSDPSYKYLTERYGLKEPYDGAGIE